MTQFWWALQAAASEGIFAAHRFAPHTGSPRTQVRPAHRFAPHTGSPQGDDHGRERQIGKLLAGQRVREGFLEPARVAALSGTLGGDESVARPKAPGEVARSGLRL